MLFRSVPLLEADVHVLLRSAAAAAAEVDVGTAHWPGIHMPFTFAWMRATAKKYFHRQKTGGMPRKPSHRAMKAEMCWILLGFRCCSSIL